MKIPTGIYNRDLIDAIVYISSTGYANRNVRSINWEVELNGELTMNSSWRCRNTKLDSVAYGIKAWIRGNYNKNAERGMNAEVSLNKTINDWTNSKQFRNYTMNVNIPSDYLWVAYDLFLGHKTDRIVKMYGSKTLNAAVGEPLNPMAVEQEKIRLEEIEKIKEEFTSRRDAEYNSYREEMKNLEKEYIAKRDAIDEEMNKKIEEVNAQFKELRNAIAEIAKAV